jgi:hypothetical protein
MKTFLRHVLAGIAASLSCQPAKAVPAPSATLSLEVTGAGHCNVRWNGRPVTQDQLLDQGVGLIESRVRQAGGPQAMTEDNIPLLRVETPDEGTWACLAPTYQTLRRSGFASVALRAARIPEAADEIAHFPLPPDDGSDSAPSAILLFGRDRTMAWNGAVIQPGELRTRLAAFRRERRLPDHDGPAAPLVVVPDASTQLAALLALIHDAHELGIETVLSNCRAPETIEAYDRGCLPAGSAVSNPS